MLIAIAIDDGGNCLFAGVVETPDDFDPEDGTLKSHYSEWQDSLDWENPPPESQFCEWLILNKGFKRFDTPITNVVV